MISDLQNPLIQRTSIESTALSRQNQQALSPIGQKSQNSATNNPYKFPDNDEIAAKTAIALEQLDLGQAVKRGSIVNILV